MNTTVLHMMTTAHKAGVLAGLALAIAWVGSAPAAANPIDGDARSGRPHTVPVAGRQIPIDAASGWYEMRGALVGAWHTVPMAVLRSDPHTPTLYAEAGVEVFNGCIDRPPRDGRCTAHDDRGEIHASYLYWVNLEEDGTTRIQGQCVHPITGGRGAFAGARGLITVVDRPVGSQGKTPYRGDILLNAVPSEGDAATPMALAKTPEDWRTSATSKMQGC
jgi:hypothetical protein